MDRREFVQRWILVALQKEPHSLKDAGDRKIVLKNAEILYDEIDALPKVAAEIKAAEERQTAGVETRNASTYYNAITGDDNGQA